MIIKIVGTERALTANSNVDSARIVRIVNNNASVTVITRNNSESTLIGNTTMRANTEMFFEKESTDELSASQSVLATPVAYTIS